jgi:hypothetical protein
MFIRVPLDQVPDKCNITRANGTASVNKDRFHMPTDTLFGKRTQAKNHTAGGAERLPSGNMQMVKILVYISTVHISGSTTQRISVVSMLFG